MRAKRARYQQGNIRKVERANGFAWEVRFSETVSGKRQQKSLYFKGDEYPTQASVRKAIQMQVALANDGNERAKVGAKFGTIISLYRKEHLPTLRKSTRSKNEYLLKFFIEAEWADFPIHDVTPLKTLKWLSGLKRVEGGDIAAPTKAGIRSVMSQCFKLAALHGYRSTEAENPMSLVTVKGVGKRKKSIIVLTQEQFKSLVSALPKPVDLMVLLAGCLGLRVGELIALHWSDIDETEKTITIQRNYTHEHLEETAKTEGSNAVLPLDDSLLAILKVHKETTGECELLFPSSRTGSYRSASILLQKTIQPVAVRLKLGRVTWHGLRHSYRSWLDAAGVPVGLQKDLLRHADIATTLNVYGRGLAPEMRAGNAAIVAGLIPDGMA